MTGTPLYELVPIERLRIHEQVEPADVRHLVGLLRSAGEVQEPLLVERRTLTILNGHHRYHALKTLGARVAPAWLVDYDDPAIELDRWGPGPPISKSDVLDHAARGVPFGVKTTRHTVRFELPYRPTALADLGVTTAPGSSTAAAARRR